MSDPNLFILQVDDEPVLLDITRTYLQTLDFMVEGAESAHEALQKMNTGSFDAIVSDYLMPEMNGIEFLKRSGEKILIFLSSYLPDRAGKKLL